MKRSGKHKQQSKVVQQQTQGQQVTSSVLSLQQRPRPLLCRIFKWTGLVGCGLLLVLSLVLYYLLFTLSGAQQALRLAQRFTAGVVVIEANITGGCVWSGLDLEKVRVQVPGVVQVDAAALSLSYDLPSALIRGTFRAELIESRQLSVELLQRGELQPAEPEPAAEDVAPTQAAAPFRLHFPLTLVVDKLKVSDFAYLSPIVDVKIKDFTAALQAVDDTATMTEAEAEHLSVHLKDDSYPAVASEALAVRLAAIAQGKEAKPFVDPAESARAQNPPKPNNVTGFDGGDGKIELLPTVFLPLDVSVLNLEVRDGRYYQASFDTGRTDYLNLSATWKGTHLSVLKLAAVHPQGEAVISGSMDFKDYFLLDFNLSAAGSISEQNRQFLGGLLYGLQGRAKVSGPLTDLNLDLQLLNPKDTQIKARLNCLSSLLPLEVQLSSPELTYPLFNVGSPEALARDLNLKASGSLQEGLNSMLQAQLTGFGFEDYAVDFAGKVSLDQLRIDKLDLDGAYRHSELSARAQGILNYGSELSYAGFLQLESSDGSALLPQLAGALACRTEFKAALSLPQGTEQQLNVSLNVPVLDASFFLNGIRSQLDARLVEGSLSEGFALESLNFTQGQNQLHFTGQIAPAGGSAVKGMLAISDFSLLVPGLEGDLDASVELAGALDDFTLRFNGHSDRIRSGNFRMSKLSFDGALRSSDERFALTALTERIRFAQGLKPARQCALDFSGVFSDHELSFICGGENRIFIGAHGTYLKEERTWQGALQELFFNSELSGSVSLAEAVDISLNLAAGSGEISPFTLRTDAGTMEVGHTSYSADSLHTSLRLNQVDLKSLNDLLPEGVRMSGPVEMDSTLSIEQGRPDLQLNLSAANARIFAKGVPLFFDTLKLTSSVKAQQAEVNAQLQLAHQRGSASLDARISDPLGSKRLNGNFKLNDLDLSLFMGVGTLFNDLQGKVNIDSTLRGSVTEPLLFGSISAAGSAEPRYDVGQIDSFDLKLNTHGQQGDLTGYVGLNSGRINLNGVLNWAQGADGRLNITASRLPAFLMGFGQAFADIDADVEFNDYYKVSGKVEVPQALIAVSSLGSGGITPSEDEILVPEDGTLALIRESSRPLPGIIDLTLSLGNEVRVDTMGLTANAIGNLRLSKELSEPEVNAQGSIALIDGKADLYGHHFIVNRALAAFNGPIADPSLDVEVIADPSEMEDNVEAGVRVSGDASAPQIALFSKPSMSQNEIMSYLLYGHGLDKNTNLNEGSNASMLVGLGVSSASGLVNSLVGAFGVQDVQVNATGSGEETQVQVQGYITRRIRVGYGYGVFNAVGEFKLRYEFMRRLYAEFVSSVDQAVDLIYSFEF